MIAGRNTSVGRLSIFAGVAALWACVAGRALAGRDGGYDPDQQVAGGPGVAQVEQADVETHARAQVLAELRAISDAMGSDDEQVRGQALAGLRLALATARHLAPDALAALEAKLRASVADLLTRDDTASRKKAASQLRMLGDFQSKANIPLFVDHVEFVRPVPPSPERTTVYGPPEPEDLPALSALIRLGNDGLEALLARAVAEDSVAVQHAFAEFLFVRQGRRTDRALSWLDDAQHRPGIAAPQRERLAAIRDVLLKRRANVRVALQSVMQGIQSDDQKVRQTAVGQARELLNVTVLPEDQPDLWTTFEDSVLDSLPALLHSADRAARWKATDQIQVLSELRSEKAIPLLVANIEFRYPSDLPYFRGAGSYTEPTPWNLPAFMALRFCGHQAAAQTALFERALGTDDRLIHECCVAFLGDAMRHQVASPSDWLEQRLAERPDLTDAQRERIADMLDMAERAARHEEMRPERFAHLYATTHATTQGTRRLDPRTELLRKLSAAKVACVRKQYDLAEQLANEVLGHVRASPDQKRRAQLILDRVAESRSGAPASQPAAPPATQPSSAPTGQQP